MKDKRGSLDDNGEQDPWIENYLANGNGEEPENTTFMKRCVDSSETERSLKPRIPDL